MPRQKEKRRVMFQVPEHTPSNRHGTWTRTIKTRISRKEEQKAPIEAYITPHTNDNELIMSAFTCQIAYFEKILKELILNIKFLFINKVVILMKSHWAFSCWVWLGRHCAVSLFIYAIISISLSFIYAIISISLSLIITYPYKLLICLTLCRTLTRFNITSIALLLFCTFCCVSFINQSLNV